MNQKKPDNPCQLVALITHSNKIPLIELELSQAKVAENDLDGEDGRKRLKRHPADDLNEERVSKRRRGSDGDLTGF